MSVITVNKFGQVLDDLREAVAAERESGYLLPCSAPQIRRIWDTTVYRWRTVQIREVGIKRVVKPLPTLPDQGREVVETRLAQIAELLEESGELTASQIIAELDISTAHSVTRAEQAGLIRSIQRPVPEGRIRKHYSAVPGWRDKYKRLAMQAQTGRPMSKITMDIREYIRDNPGCRTRDIAEHFEMETRAVSARVHSLIRYGTLTRYYDDERIFRYEIGGDNVS